MIRQFTIIRLGWDISNPMVWWCLRPHSLMLRLSWIGTNLDRVEKDDTRWSASPARRFERLLRETGIPIGLLFNGIEFRLMYAPRGENSGSLTFPVEAMTEVAGRPILAAFHKLLGR